LLGHTDIFGSYSLLDCTFQFQAWLLMFKQTCCQHLRSRKTTEAAGSSENW